jgi:hypothetical protein
MSSVGSFGAWDKRASQEKLENRLS